MGMSIGELFVELGFDVDDAKLKSFNDEIKGAALELTKLAGIAGATLFALDKFIDSSLQRALGIKNFTSETGQAAEGMLRFASAVNQTNAAISTAAASQSYYSFGRMLADLSQGKGDPGAIARLTGGAYEIGDTEEKVIEKIRAFMPELIRQSGGGVQGTGVAASLLQQVGLGAGSIRAFGMSPTEYRNATQAYVDAELQAADANAQLANQMAKTQQTWEALKDSLVSEWAPTLIGYFQELDEWLIKIKPDIDNLIKSINEMADALGGWKTVGEAILDFFIAKWVVGMLAGIARVSSALLGVSAAGTSLFAGVAGAVGAVGALGTGAAALGVGAAIPLILDKQFNWGQKVADWLVPVGAEADRARKQEYFTRDGITQNNTYYVDSAAAADELVEQLQRQRQDNLNVPYLSYYGQGKR